MPTYIALLRAVNVAGRNLVAMPELRELLERLGMTDVRSLLQSGNLIFETGGSSPDRLERMFEAATQKQFDLSVDYFVRTSGEWRQIVSRNPDPDESARDPGRHVVMLLKKHPEGANVQSLRDAAKGPETFHADGRQLYIAYPNGIGRSKLTTALIERKLNVRGTGRNWNTALKIAAIASAMPQ